MSEILYVRRLRDFYRRQINEDEGFCNLMISKLGKPAFELLQKYGTEFERVFSYQQDTPLTGYCFGSKTKKYAIFVKGYHINGLIPVKELYELYCKGLLGHQHIYPVQVFHLKATNYSYLSFLEKGYVAGDLSELYSAVALYRKFSLKGYLSSSYFCQLFFDYLTSEESLNSPKGTSTERYLKNTSIMLEKCRVEGVLSFLKGKKKYTLSYSKDDGLQEELYIAPTKLLKKEYSSKEYLDSVSVEDFERLTIPLVSDVTKKIKDAVSKKLDSLFTEWSESSNFDDSLYLKVLEHKFLEQITVDYFEIDNSNVKVNKPFTCKFTVAYANKMVAETNVIPKGSIRVRVLEFLYSTDKGSLVLKDCHDVPTSELQGINLEFTLPNYTVVSFSDSSSVIFKKRNLKPAMLSWSYSPGFLRRVKNTINVPAVRNKLGKFYCDAFDLLMKDKEAFESKYLSNEVDIYNFYYNLLECYSSFAITNSGLFKVADLKGTDEDFSEDTIRQALKIVNSHEESYKKELKGLRKTAKGTNVKI